MYQDTIDYFGTLAQNKARVLSESPLAFAVGSLMAGAYVGIGIILIFSVGGTLDPAWQKLIMGVSFGIALTLVVFAGSELFTGHTMYMVFGCLMRQTTLGDLGKVWAASWVFNLLGSVGLALLFAFIASGFEHSVANMTLLSIALLGDHPDTIGVAAMGYNLLWVTVGNIIGGSVLMGLGYWYATNGRRSVKAAAAQRRKSPA